MNDKNMSILLKNYKDHLNMMNDGLHDEVYKWDAVRYFQDNWDIDEDNFGAMFENAVSLSGNIMNSNNHPAEGIIEIAKYEDEAVRTLFRELFAEDGGDLKVREDKIQDFIDKSEELRKQYASENWRFAQDFRSALVYLSLYSPDDNYLYHPTAVQKIVTYVEIGRELGNGKNFSLAKYYKFCDEIREVLEKDEELLNSHDELLRETAYPDTMHHILTYDFISCAENYQLYDNLTVSKKATRGTSKEIDAHVQRIDQMETECRQIKEKLESLTKEIEVLFCYNMKGLDVNHKKYGAGKVTEQEGNHLTVDFTGVEKAFLLPEAFANKFLTSEKAEVAEHYLLLANKVKEVKSLRNQLKLEQYELDLER